MPASSFFTKAAFVGNIGVDGFSLGSDDISHVLAYLNSAQGRDATIRSPTYFWDQALHVQRPTDLKFGVAHRCYLALNHDVDVFYPQFPNSIVKDDFLFADCPAEIRNKTISPLTNNLNGIEKFPDFAKSGKFQGNNYKGEGIMESLVHRHIPELKGDSLEGSYAQYETPVVVESSTGFWVPNNFLTMGKFDPIVKFKIRLPDWQINTNRLFFGLVSADSVLNNDVPFGLGDSALLMGFRNGDSDFKLIRGIGNGNTSVSPHSTNYNMSLSTAVFEFGFKDFGQTVYYKIGEDSEAQEITFSTQLPDPNRWLKLHFDIQNSTAISKTADIFYARIESKK